MSDGGNDDSSVENSHDSSSSSSSCASSSSSSLVTLDDADRELEDMKRRVAEMEAEAANMQHLDSNSNSSNSNDAAEVDSRSVYVGSVDYSTTPDELTTLFSACGTVKRATILCDKTTGHPKGFAYVEFVDQGSVSNAVLLNDTEFKGRQIKVMAKRTNIPFFQRGGMRGGQRGRGRGRGRGGRGGGGGMVPPPLQNLMMMAALPQFNPYATYPGVGYYPAVPPSARGGSTSTFRGAYRGARGAHHSYGQPY